LLETRGRLKLNTFLTKLKTINVVILGGADIPPQYNKLTTGRTIYHTSLRTKVV